MVDRWIEQIKCDLLLCCSCFTISALFASRYQRKNVPTLDAHYYSCKPNTSFNTAFSFRLHSHNASFMSLCFLDKTIELPSSSSYFDVDWFRFIYCLLFQFRINFGFFFLQEQTTQCHTDKRNFRQTKTNKRNENLIQKPWNKQITILMYCINKIFVNVTGSFHFF